MGQQSGDQAMGEAAPKDNSMEEILASIRRIISSDDGVPAADSVAAEKDSGASPGQSDGERAASGREERAMAEKDAEVPSVGGAGQPEPPALDPSLSKPQVLPRAQAGTLAGLAQQLRGTRSDSQSEPASSQSSPAETGTVTEAGGAASRAREDNEAQTNAPPVSNEAASRTSQSLADLARSINSKIESAGHDNTDAPEDAQTSAQDVSETNSVLAGTKPSAETGASENETEKPALSAGSISKTDQPVAVARDRDHDTSRSAQQGLSDGVLEELREDREPASQTGRPTSQTNRPTSQTNHNEPETAVSAGTVSADQPEAFKEALVSPSTERAVSASMGRLEQAASDLSQAQVEAVLRPLLTDWLDEHLPALVERMVQQEIDRIATTAPAGEPENEILQSKTA